MIMRVKIGVFCSMQTFFYTMDVYSLLLITHIWTLMDKSILFLIQFELHKTKSKKDDKMRHRDIENLGYFRSKQFI